MERIARRERGKPREAARPNYFAQILNLDINNVIFAAITTTEKLGGCYFSLAFIFKNPRYA
jgi:hypothetical protein